MAVLLLIPIGIIIYSQLHSNLKFPRNLQYSLGACFDNQYNMHAPKHHKSKWFQTRCHGVSALLSCVISNLLLPFKTNHDQPEPNSVADALLNLLTNFSKLPKASSINDRSLPSGFFFPSLQN